jgi:Protein of unknown function DUF262
MVAKKPVLIEKSDGSGAQHYHVAVQTPADASFAPGSYRRQSPPLSHTGMDASSMTLGQLVSTTSRTEWDLSADYQRGSVWDDERAQKLIRSLLERVPVGSITLAETSFDTYRDTGFGNRVVDGKQRIQALWKFADGDLPVPLDWFPDDWIDDSVEPEFIDGVAHGRMGKQFNVVGYRMFKSLSIGVNTFKPYSQVVEVGEGKGNGGRDNAYLTTTRTEAETIKEEARVFGLINAGGVAQTEETLANARAFE